MMLNLCKMYGLPCRIKRYIPDDYRKKNYEVAEGLLNDAYELQIEGKPWHQQFWAGMYIQNLKEPIEALAERGALRTIRNMSDSIAAHVMYSIKKG